MPGGMSSNDSLRNLRNRFEVDEPLLETERLRASEVKTLELEYRNRLLGAEQRLVVARAAPLEPCAAPGRCTAARAPSLPP